jgi:hypothetical protein
MAETPIRVFVGCSPDGLDAESQAVVEHSMRSRSSMPIDLTWAIHSDDPASPWYGWDRSQWATPFSGFRWRVPEACAYEGRAVYCDSDIIFLADIAELWNVEIAPGKVVVARGGWRFCVCLWDCAAAKQHILPAERLLSASGHRKQNDYFMRRADLVQATAAAWNALDGEFPIEATKALHYSALPSQPSTRHAAVRLSKQGRKHWYKGPTAASHARPWVSALFDRELKAAIEAGYTIDRYDYDSAKRPA